jgi:mono/diheme cytochrome c family protein
LILSALALLAFPLVSQQQPSPTPPVKNTMSYAAIPAEAARIPNPVKSSPESIARAKRWWAMDCEMCHGKDGNGKGDTGKEMKLPVADLSDPATLKERSDGEIFYVIKNGHNDMPAEGPRIKAEENWDLVNYVRSLVKQREAATKPQ